MFLLIRFIRIYVFGPVLAFKFHYVSINSRLHQEKSNIRSPFKFHYVSINSKIQTTKKKAEVSLNSIMFLLIHMPTAKRLPSGSL